MPHLRAAALDEDPLGCALLLQVLQSAGQGAERPCGRSGPGSADAITPPSLPPAADRTEPALDRVAPSRSGPGPRDAPRKIRRRPLPQPQPAATKQSA